MEGSDFPGVDIVIPVLNEERGLPTCVGTLRKFLPGRLSLPHRIVIADNGSTDATLTVAQSLAQQHPDVTVIYLPERGRGRALRKAWLESDAQVLCYMDVDLSTDLSTFPALVTAIAEEGYDLAIGSRLQRQSQTTRRLKREVLSRGYNLLIRLLFWPGFTDAQCGFKAISRRAARILVPLVQDNAWFFDTELLLIAAKRGFRIKELPVRWVDDPNSRVKVLRTVTMDLLGLARLRFGGIPCPPQGPLN